MVPFQPPLPMAWKSLFQPEAGSQTSILMSETADGDSVANTRQNSGKLLKGPRLTGNPPGAAGGKKAPAATLWADVIVTFGRLSLERLSQGDPPVGAAAREPAEIMPSVAIGNFIVDSPSPAIVHLRLDCSVGVLFWDRI